MSRKILLLALALVACLIGYAAYRHSIRFSLYQAYKAYKKHDITTFEKYVDLDGLLSNLIDDLTNIQGTDDSWLNDIIDGLVSVVKPQILPSIKQDVINLIEQGTHEQQASSVDGQNLFNTLINRYLPHKNKKLFRGISYTIRDGKIAYVGLLLFHPRYDTTLTLEVKMRNKGSYWQIASITNINSYIHSVDSLEQIRTDRVNRELVKKMNNILQLKGYSKTSYLREGFFFSTHYIRCKFILENTSDKEIVGFQARAYCLSPDGDTLKRFTLSSGHRLEPNKRDTLQVSTSVSLYNRHGAELYKLTAPKLKVRIEVTHIIFADGRELRLLDKWE